MAIPGESIAIVILLDELELQCRLAQAAIERLQAAAAAWRNNIPGKGAPLQIVSDCIVCLSASAAIYRLLEPGERKGKRLPVPAKRCKALRRVLGYPPLVEAKKQGTRNSWEHMDERLDVVFTSRSYTKFSPVHLAPQPPTPDTFVHHHFDPVAVAIKHGPDSIRLEALHGECSNLLEAIRYAMLELAIGVHAPYPIEDRA